MVTEDLFELFIQYDELPANEKESFLSHLKQKSPEKAHQLELLSQVPHDFTQQFVENIRDYGEQLSAPTVKSGDEFGVYTLVKELGVGGMGHVYLAKRHDGLIDQKVAIKFLHSALYQLNSTQTLLNEAQALANLNHPNIATIFDVVKTDDGLVYMVMEYIEGCTLTVHLERNTLTVKDKLNLFELIADAAQEAHSKRIIHADIKPSNILITENGQPQLIDFGIMQFIGCRDEKSSSFINQYLCAMTVNYAAPEQLQGESATIQSDVYALGGLLYFILSGQTPFEQVGGSLAEKIKAISENALPACVISEKVKFKKDIDWILQTCLAKFPEQRFRTVDALNSEIKKHQNNSPLDFNQTFFYRLSKSWQRHKVGYVLSFSFAVLIVSFGIKAWYDNVQIQRSYTELTSSYLNQYTSLQEVINKTDEINLPSPDSVPIDLYIKLAFQKFEQQIITDESKNKALLTIKKLKQVLNEKGFSNTKTLKLIDFRLFFAETSFDNEKDTQEYENKFKTLSARDYLETEEIIDILFFSSGSDIELIKKTYSIVLEELGKSTNIKQISLLSLIKYNIINASYFSAIESTKNIFPSNYSNSALSLAENNPENVPSFIYLMVLDAHNTALESRVGYTDEYFEFIKKMKIHLSRIHFSKGNAIAENLMLLIDKVEQFQSIRSNIPIKFEDYSKAGSINAYMNSVRYLLAIGAFDDVHRLSDIKRSNESRLLGKESPSLIVTDTFTTELNLKSGVIDESIYLINQKLIPHYDEYYSDDWKASYLQKFCIPLSYHLTVEELEQFCHQPYFLVKPILGETNFWTDYTLNQLVWWYGLNPQKKERRKEEKKHVERLESIVTESMNFFKVQQLESLIFYFIKRNNLAKANFYLELLDSIIKDYAGDMYVVHIDRSKTFRAEVKLLEGDRFEAIELLKDVSNTVCEYQPKNYLRMHLNQIVKKAEIVDVCLNL